MPGIAARGDGVIVRGAPAKVSRNDRQPHFARSDAESLLTEAPRRYRSEHGNLPCAVPKLVHGC